MYALEIRHKGLHKYRLIKGTDYSVVAAKARAQSAAWDEMWERRLAIENRHAQKAQAVQEKSQKLESAAEQTRELQEIIASMDELLRVCLMTSSVIDWNTLKNTEPFSEPNPIEPTLPILPPSPRRNDSRFQPNLNFWDRLFPALSVKKLKATALDYHNAYTNWQNEVARLPEMSTFYTARITLKERVVRREKESAGRVPSLLRNVKTRLWI